MTAPGIPDLRTLMGSRGRGRSSGLHQGGQPRRPRSPDTIVQETDYDARTASLSAIQAGYFDDEFAALFIDGPVGRRLPMLNRGTYLRTYAIERLVNSFLTAYDVDSSEATCQIISLGAGTDTRFFRIASGEYRSNFDNNPFRKYPCNYHEIDMPENNAKKIRTIIDRYELISRIPGRVQVNENGTGLRSPTYCIHSYDLRSLRPLLPSESPKSHPLCSEPHGIDRTLPTLLISECCLVYLDSLRSTSALLFFTNLFAKEIPLSLIIYEPIKPFDPFGVTMERNLSLRGITLPGLKEFPSLEKQKDRLSNLFRNGERWASKAIDFNMIWRFWLDRYEKQRIEWLEMLDEVEEWETMAEHYCIAWGWRGGNKIDWQEWRSLPAGVVEGMPSGEALDSTPEEWTE